MSIKIYQAYRCHLKNFNETLKLFHGLILNKVVSITKDFIDGIEEDKIREKYNIPESTNVNLQSKILFFDNFLSETFENEKVDLFGCGLNIWFHNDNMVYFIPWGMPGIIDVLYKQTYPDWIEEYCYYNNVDKPKKIPMKKWREREKKWNEIIGNGYNDYYKHRLTHNIVTSSNWSGTCVLFSEIRKIYDN